MPNLRHRGHNFRKSVCSAVAAFAIAATGGIVTATPADAAEGRNLVTFGDSYLSNPLPAEAVGSRVRLEAERAGVPLDNPVAAPLNQFTRHGCGQSPTNAPRQMGQMKGLEVRDYSCPGALAYAPNGQSMTLHGEINNALADGALDANTSNVVIQFGFNDSYSWLLGKVVQDGLPNTYNNLGARYAEQKVLWDNAMNSAIDRIKAAAPNARITVADYPTISKTETAEQCLVHVEVLPGDVGIPAFWIRDAEVNIHDWAAELAARRSGENVVFANLRDATAGSGECAPDDSRMIAGVIDTTNRTGYNLPVHMTHWGVNHAANVIAATF
ncbi:GDSL-type esterase/lipase family protein [Corynebacterium sp. UBA2622]|uniref:GDSL-type esterase/lipase family protein n=1 Tax=Corynebacterium sp. UBA2622 TaxID=1946393 RepID=UPI0025C0A573|nr:GDSL-type esterase/lipase family protein [Corynebacterium sp. UBA2622]